MRDIRNRTHSALPAVDGGLRVARLLTLLLIMVATVLTGAAEDKTHRVPRIASGDITSARAVIWGQIDTSGEMEVEYSLDSHFIDSTRAGDG